MLLDSVVRERCVCVCVLCYRSKRWISLLVLGFSVNATLEVGWTRFNFIFFLALNGEDLDGGCRFFVFLLVLKVRECDIVMKEEESSSALPVLVF